MEVFSYRTIQLPAEGHYKDKGSKFLGFAYPVQSEEDVKARIIEAKKVYFDARHHCFAYVLGADKSKFRAFDDGEPNHSAGDPILGQIRSKKLTNVLVIVVRYFGGVKLGIGGLVSAYKAAAEDALQQAVVVEKEVVKGYLILYEYSATPEVMRLIKEFNITIVDQQFGEQCSMQAEISLKMKEGFLDKIDLMKALGTQLTVKVLEP
jgi:uncharacterized YigZ family protein